MSAINASQSWLKMENGRTMDDSGYDYYDENLAEIEHLKSMLTVACEHLDKGGLTNVSRDLAKWWRNTKKEKQLERERYLEGLKKKRDEIIESKTILEQAIKDIEFKINGGWDG